MISQTNSVWLPNPKTSPNLDQTATQTEGNLARGQLSGYPFNLKASHLILQ